MSARAAVDGFRAGAGMAGRRLWRPGTAAVVLLMLATTATVAIVERGAGPLAAPDRTLSAVLGALTPLLALALVTQVLGRQKTSEAVWPVVRFGAPAGQVVLGMLTVAALAGALLASVSTALGLVIAYGALPGMAADLVTSSWIAALGAAAYVAWFGLAGCWFRRGRGRWMALLGDLTLGGGTGLFAFPWPRAHLQSLAGGEAVLALGQAPSSVVLLVIALGGALLAAMIVGR